MFELQSLIFNYCIPTLCPIINNCLFILTPIYGMQYSSCLKCVTHVHNTCIYIYTCRGVGCIFYEMIVGRPMFPGSNVEEELLLIWKVR